MFSSAPLLFATSSLLLPGNHGFEFPPCLLCIALDALCVWRLRVRNQARAFGDVGWLGAGVKWWEVNKKNEKGKGRQGP